MLGFVFKQIIFLLDPGYNMKQLNVLAELISRHKKIFP